MEEPLKYDVGRAFKIGYARVSTKDQNLELQTDALEKYGCDEIFGEKASSVKKRPELERMLQSLRRGDTVVVWKLDRLGRSLKELVSLVSGFVEKGVNFISLKDNIDTATSQGRLFFNIVSSLAEYEREMVRERTMAGLQAARERGRVGGRRPGLSTMAQKTAKAAKMLYLQNDPKLGVDEICGLLGIGSKATLYRYLRHAGVEINK